MTLGAWMRSYLYIPLGGSRGGLFKTCQNLFVVMVVVGIWHGANWGFVVWGVFHGVLLVLHRLIIAIGALYPWLAKIWQPWPLQLLAWAMTQCLVLVSWVPFRLPELRDSWMFFQRCWGFAGDPQFGVKIYVTSLGLTAGQIGALLATVFILMAITYGANRTRWELNWQTKLFLVPVALYLVGILGTDKKLPFIYFGF
jgi:alginate O-acetyltransferase complex protein AlgI